MKREKVVGEHGEKLAESVLSGMGIEMIERVGTPIKAIPAGKGLFKVIWGEKVSGDRRGILPGGKSVLIEVKTILDHNLVYSDLRKHQPERLKIHATFGGLSLLVWVHDSGEYVMMFPIACFEPRKSLTPEVAYQHHLQTVEYLKQFNS
jgi:hypothetical protein